MKRGKKKRSNIFINIIIVFILFNLVFSIQKMIIDIVGVEVKTERRNTIIRPQIEDEQETKVESKFDDELQEIQGVAVEKVPDTIDGIVYSRKLSQITTESTTKERIFSMMQYLIENGFSTEAAAGVVGNIAVESGFNPSKVSPSGYYGLCQWNTNCYGEYWWNDISSWLLNNGYDWNSFEGQVRSILECPNKGQLTESRLVELKGLKNVEQATELFCVFYEACVGYGEKTVYYNIGMSYQSLTLRKSEAWIAYLMYNDASLEYTGERAYLYY